MGVSYVSWYIPIVILVCSTAHLKAMYLIHTTEYMENNQCVMRLAIEGHGIDDVLYTNCEAGRNMKIRVKHNELLIGDSQDPLSAFSDKPDYLVVEDKARNVIEQRTYDKGLRVMINDIKRPFKWTFVNYIISMFSSWTAQVIVIKKETLSKDQANCVGSIAVKGGKINYVEDITCAQVQEIRVVRSPLGVVVGNYRGAEHSLLFMDPKYMVQINTDKSCKLKFFKGDYSSATGTGEPVADEDCKQAKNIVDIHLGVRIYRRSYWKGDQNPQDIMIRGYGIAETLTVPSRLFADVMDIKYSFKRGVLLVGNYRKYEMSAYSDTPGNLVVIEGEKGVCTMRIYEEEGVLSSKEVMEEKLCLNVKSRIDKAWKEVKIGGGPVVEGSFYEFIIKTTKPELKHGTSSEYRQNLIVSGDGIEYVLHHASAADQLELHTTPRGLVLCDYEKQDVCVVAELRSVVRLDKGKCSTITLYDGDSHKYNERVADQATCAAAKDKVSNCRTRKL